MTVCRSATIGLLHRIRKCLGLPLLAGVFVLGCADAMDAGPEPRPLTSEEASLLAAVLYNNHVAGSAVFELYSVVTPGGDQVFMSGTVDWSRSRGVAEVVVASTESTLEAVVWNGGFVAERHPKFDQLLASRGVESPGYIVRPADFDRRLDAIIQIVASLASANPENQLLLRQTRGSAYLREDTLRGRSVDVLRFGDRSIYWLDRATGELVRFEGNNQAGTLPIVIDLTGQPADVVLPRAQQLIGIDQLPELEALMSAL